LDGGINEYTYSEDLPTVLTDRLGLASKKPKAQPQKVPPPDCGTICSMAYANPDLNTGGGGVVCLDGKKCPCAFDTNFTKKGECSDLDASILKHETAHVPETVCPKKGLCRGVFKPAYDPSKNECKHRRDSRDDLTQAITKGFNTQACKNKMFAQIVELSQFIQKNCH
jgi:hypothetical protein